MTEQERREAFVKAMQEAEQRFGYTITVTTQVEKLGEAVLVKPVMTIVPVQGWTTTNNNL